MYIIGRVRMAGRPVVAVAMAAVVGIVALALSAVGNMFAVVVWWVGWGG